MRSPRMENPAAGQTASGARYLLSADASEDTATAARLQVAHLGRRLGLSLASAAVIAPLVYSEAPA